MGSKRTLVTGCYGQLGRAVRALAERRGEAESFDFCDIDTFDMGDPDAYGQLDWGAYGAVINCGAYTSELIRSAIQAVDKGQWEASETLGLGYIQMMRYIILPQAFKRIIPPMVSEFITLIKDSSLLSTIGVVELLQAAKTIGTRTYNYVPPLLMASVIYLALTLTISRFSKRLEERMALSD